MWGGAFPGCLPQGENPLPIHAPRGSFPGGLRGPPDLLDQRWDLGALPAEEIFTGGPRHTAIRKFAYYGLRVVKRVGHVIDIILGGSFEEWSQV